mmetsp:Transcript_44845/g.111424  ORF Transcript_44845/g.111424 Transcript_44845/m.111424 type:complete len:99 (+) Transcript_44845:155-451(+)
MVDRTPRYRNAKHMSRQSVCEHVFVPVNVLCGYMSLAPLCCGYLCTSRFAMMRAEGWLGGGGMERQRNGVCVCVAWGRFALRCRRSWEVADVRTVCDV